MEKWADDKNKIERVEEKKEEVKDRLKQVRESMMLTQTEMAERLNTTRGNYAAYESGLRNMSDKTMRKYSEILKINPAWLRFGNSENALFAFDKTDEKEVKYKEKEIKIIKKNENAFIKDKLIESINSLDNTQLKIFYDVMRKFTDTDY